jgi:hypothetical protein
MKTTQKRSQAQLGSNPPPALRDISLKNDQQQMFFWAVSFRPVTHDELQ